MEQKKYISPQMLIVLLKTETIVATSFEIEADEKGTEQLVKEDVSSNSNYNVWDDDWSK